MIKGWDKAAQSNSQFIGRRLPVIILLHKQNNKGWGKSKTLDEGLAVTDSGTDGY